MSIVTSSIFLDFNLPNAATWFYFAGILVIALFFRFNRCLSLRNWDVLSLFLLVPGFLLLQEAGQFRNRALSQGLGTTDFFLLNDLSAERQLSGYIWLISGSGYLFLRCLLDLTLERRPVLPINLNFSGLTWMVVALMVCLSAVAVRRGPDFAEQIGKGPIVLEQVQNGATAVVSAQTGQGPHEWGTVRYWVTRVVAMMSHISIVMALVWIGCRHYDDITAGMGAAALYLLLPYTSFHIAQIHHVLPTCLLLWAIFAYRRPAISGALMGVSAGLAFFPFVLLPLWIGFYWGRGLTRYLKSYVVSVVMCLSITITILWMDGQLQRQFQFALNLADWQPWRMPTEPSLWNGIHWAYRMPVFISYIAFMAITSFWPSPKNLAHLLALSASLLIGMQFWYADQGGVYALWYMPLMVLLVFRPNLTDKELPRTSARTAEYTSQARPGAIEEQQSGSIGVGRVITPPAQSVYTSPEIPAKFKR